MLEDEILNEVIEEEAHETLDDVVSSCLPPFPNVHDDVSINDELSYLFDDEGVAHDDY